MTNPVCTEADPEDVGHGVTVHRRYMDGVLAGFAYDHSRPDGTECPSGKGSWIPVVVGETSRHEWTLHSESPLTVSPSLLCPVCNHHGFIQGGRWVPA